MMMNNIVNSNEGAVIDKQPKEQVLKDTHAFGVRDVIKPVKNHFDEYPYEAGQSVLLGGGVGLLVFSVMEMIFMRKHAA